MVIEGKRGEDRRKRHRGESIENREREREREGQRGLLKMKDGTIRSFFTILVTLNECFCPKAAGTNTIKLFLL